MWGTPRSTGRSFFTLTRPKWRFRPWDEASVWWTLHVTANTPSHLWSMVVAASCCGVLLGSRPLKRKKINAAKQNESNIWIWLFWRRFVFQQDTELKHTAKATQEWFKDNNVNVWEWLSQSPEHNPLENLWLDLRRVVTPDACVTWQNLGSFAKKNWVKLQCPDERAWLSPTHTDSVLWLKPKVYLLNTDLKGGGGILMQSLILYSIFLN